MPVLKHLALRLVAPLMAAALLAPLSAQASILDSAAHFLDFGGKADPTQITAPTQIAALTPMAVTAPVLATQVAVPAVEMPSLPVAANVALPAPSVETPLHKLFCVEYARAVSGLAIFGDAKLWWSRAKNLYARAAMPVENAVMVFSASSRLKLGHVAVVTDIVSPREIRVEQANWQNHGEIDHATPVLDVSAANNWTKVRVWDIASGAFGSHVYAISGFIAKDLVKQARND